MGLKHIRLKFKVLKLRSFLSGKYGSSNRKPAGNGETPTWAPPISHGSYVVEDRSTRGFISEPLELHLDTIVVQREEIGRFELWFYGVFDARVGSGISRHVQSHLFSKQPKESQVRHLSKEVMKKAYLNVRAKCKENMEGDEKKLSLGSASVLVINGEKMVIANMGDYRAVVCRDGMAHQLGPRGKQSSKGYWPHSLISGAIRRSRARQSKYSDTVVSAQKIDSETEFIILASSGVWEVMKHQEAVSLIRHIDDAQEAAQCLAKEALTRMSRSNISCLVIRFD